MRNPWPEFGWGDSDEPGPQTEDSVERGFLRESLPRTDLGRSDSVDLEDTGDIADEGPGRRG